MATENIYLLNMPLGWERQLWIMVAVCFAKVCDQQVPPMDAIVDNNVGLRWLLVFFLCNLISESSGFYSIVIVKQESNAVFAEFDKLDMRNNLIWAFKELNIRHCTC